MKTYKTTISALSLKWEKTDFPKARILSSVDAVDYARQFYHDDINIYESFFLILLNSDNMTIGYAKISQGGCTGTVVDSKIIAKYCIDSLAQACILVHNHPSGATKPSEKDKTTTELIIKTLNIFGCTVHDHIILTSDSYFSFKNNDLI